MRIDLLNTHYEAIAHPLIVIRAAALGVLTLQLTKDKNEVSQGDVFVTVRSGVFRVDIHASGELAAKRSEKIKGPQGLRNVGVYQLTITNLVPEGTLVEKGQFVASLDRTELDNKIKETETEIDKINTQLDQARIDTAIEMRSLRDELINTRFAQKEKELSLELSKYEPQSIIRKAQLDLERSKRDYTQLENKLVLTKEKSIAVVEEINASYRQLEYKMNRLLDFRDQMTITAPNSGMVIYVRNWNGKRGPGSQISGYNPVVAQLPDLSQMITKSYINEVDISKVAVGQPTRIHIDAFPEKEYHGIVVQVANIGEQVRNFDTKVFEVVVKLHDNDSLLRPAMTSGIDILVDSLDVALYVPLEAIQSDSLNFVFLQSKSGLVRQEIITGISNDIDIVIAAGLQVGDQVSLNIPENADDLTFVYLDQSVKESVNNFLADALRERMLWRNELAKKVTPDDLPGDVGSTSNMIIF